MKLKLFIFLALPCVSSVDLTGATYLLRGYLRYEVQLTDAEIGARQKALDDNQELRRFLEQIPTAAELAKPLSREFEVEVDDQGRWKISVVLVGNPNFDRLISQYDNENLAYYSVTPSTNLHVVTVSHSDVPQTRTTAGDEFVWLAFASGAYFKRATNGLAISLKARRLKNGTFERDEVPVVLNISPHPPYVPIHIQYGGKSPPSKGDASSAEYRPRISLESLTAEFSAAAFTNVSGHSFPTSFNYAGFRPAVDSDDGIISIPSFVVTASVTNVSVHSGAIDFRLPSRFAVYDRRIEVPTDLYVATDGVLPPTNSQIVEAARTTAAEKMAKRKGLHRRGTASNVLLYAVVLIAFALFPIYLVYRRN
jgi:hypothetical protein